MTQVLPDRAPGGPARVLFGSKPDWEPGIRSGLRAKCEITFMDLRRIANLADYDAIVPLTVDDSMYLSREHAGLRHRKFLTPPADVMGTACDKVAFNDFLKRHGYERHLPGPAGSGPSIVKKRVDEWGVHSRLVHAHESLAFDPDEYFVQAFVPGRVEFATHVLAKRGEILFHTSRRHTLGDDWFVKGRDCMPDETEVVATECLPLLQSIIREPGYTGFACLDYKIVDGVVKIFELNPRMGESLITSIDEAIDAYIACLE